MGFLKSSLLVGLLVIIENASSVAGDVICSSGDGPLSEQKTCDFGLVCCGERNTECCIDDWNRDQCDYRPYMRIILLLLLFCALLVVACCLGSCCFCWYFNRKSRSNNQGVVYSQAATMDGTVSFPLNRVMHISQHNQNQAIPPYGMSSSVYNETTQILSPAGSPSAPVDDDQLQIVKSEA